ncbi:hypothetical protein ACFLZT_00480 [Thermodesulfobacteriota bacterium]
MNMKKDSSTGLDNTSSFSASFPGLVDLVMEDRQTNYLYKTSDDWKITNHFEDRSGIIFQPPGIDAIPFPLVSAGMVLANQKDNDHNLYIDIVERLKSIVKLPSEEHYHLVAVYIFFTYMPEIFFYYPYLWFYGLPERGKSRVLKAVVNLSYRGFYTETLNEAYIFRFADGFKGTLGLDLYEISQRAQMKGSYDLLLGRYERGMKTPRVTAYDKGPFKDITYYDVAGATVLATNKDIGIHDPLRSRCIQIIMPEARGRYPNNNSIEALMDLKARLIAFRGRHLGETLPEIGKPIEGRLGDITHPLITIASLLPNEASMNLLTLIGNLETERKEIESDNPTSKIAQALYNLQGSVENGRLPVSDLKKILDKDLRFKMYPQAIGRELTALMIKRIKSMGTMHIIWDEKIMLKIWERYSIPGD